MLQDLNDVRFSTHVVYIVNLQKLIRNSYLWADHEVNLQSRCENPKYDLSKETETQKNLGVEIEWKVFFYSIWSEN